MSTKASAAFGRTFTDPGTSLNSSSRPSTLRYSSSVYVYVPDVDAVYRRAIDLGARSISVPEDKPYNERQAGFIDVAGNTWWVSKYLG